MKRSLVYGIVVSCLGLGVGAGNAPAQQRSFYQQTEYKGQEIGTIESAVFDVAGRKMHIFYKRDYDHGLVLNVDDELAKGPRSESLSKIFPNPVPFEAGWRIETGPYTAKAEK